MILRRLSLRVRITGGSLLIAVLLSLAAGMMLTDQIRRIAAQGEEGILRSIEGTYRAALANEPQDSLDQPGAGQLVAVVDSSGTAQLDTLPEALRGLLPRLVAGAGDTRLVSADGVPYLVRASTILASDGSTWTVVTARDGRTQASVLAQATTLVVVSLVVLDIGVGAASWFIAGAALRPVERMRRAAERLVELPGVELLPADPVGDEIARLATTLNTLITDLRHSAARERQIVSDASHELRTPLAILQAQLELARTGSGGAEEVRRDVAAAQATLARLSSLATSLLELSRIDAQMQGGSASVEDLARELTDAADRARVRAAARSVDIEYEVEVTDGAGVVAVSVEDFGRIVDNLVNNSLAAIADAGTVRLSLGEHSGGLTLTVVDDGGGMDEAFAPHATERFSRHDASRTRGGAGLGLSIVAGIADLAGGELRLLNRPGEGVTASVDFPFRPAE